MIYTGSKGQLPPLSWGGGARPSSSQIFPQSGKVPEESANVAGLFRAYV